MILTKNEVDEFAKKLDDLTPWNDIIKNKLIGATIETGDRWVYRMLINLLNDQSNKIPERFHDEIRDLVKLFIVDDYEGFIPVVARVIAELNVISKAILDNEMQAKVFEVNLRAGLEIAQYYASVKK